MAGWGVIGPRRVCGHAPGPPQQGSGFVLGRPLRGRPPPFPKSWIRLWVGHAKAFIYPVMGHWGESQSAPVQGRLEPPTCRSIVQHANHQTTMTAQSQRINNTPRGILNLGGSSAKIASQRVGQPKGAEDRERDNGLIYMY